MKRYTEWTHNEMECVTKNILMTLSYMNKHKGRDEGNAYSSTQLDDVEHCVRIICMLHGMHVEDTETKTTVMHNPMLPTMKM